VEQAIAASEVLVSRPRPQRGARALRAVRIIHPFPTLLNVAATAGLACVAVRGIPETSLFVRMLAMMFSAQSAIGVTNDYYDHELDLATKPSKPIAAGLVSSGFAVLLGLALIAATIAIAATLGPAGLALAMLGLACGLVYDARLKRTMLSALPYMVAIPTLPLWVWATLGEWRGVLWWLFPLGALLGLALHLANTLPDIDDDRSFGVEGLAHRLGSHRSMFLGWTSFALALALSLVIAPLVSYAFVLFLPAFALAGACLASGLGLYAVRRDAFALQFGFGALAVGSVVIAVGWLAAVT